MANAAAALPAGAAPKAPLKSWIEINWEKDQEWGRLETKLEGYRTNPEAILSQELEEQLLDEATAIFPTYRRQAAKKISELKKLHFAKKFGAYGFEAEPREYKAEEITENYLNGFRELPGYLKKPVPIFSSEFWMRRKNLSDLKKHFSKNIDGLCKQVVGLYSTIQGLRPAEDDANLSTYKTQVGKHADSLVKVLQTLEKYGTLHPTLTRSRTDLSQKLERYKREGINSLLSLANRNYQVVRDTGNARNYELALFYVEKAEELVGKFWPQESYRPKPNYNPLRTYFAAISDLNQRLEQVKPAPAAPITTVNPAPAPTPGPVTTT